MKLLLVLVLVVSTIAAFGQSVGGTKKGVEVSATGVLAEDVGIETLGGVFTALIKRGCKVPCASTMVFSTADDGQSEIKISVFRGIATMAKDAERVGKFVVTDVPSQPRGVPNVAVTFTAGLDGVTLSALDKHTGHLLKVERREF